MTLRNVPHHFAKYHRGGTKPSEDCTFSFWLGSSCVEGHPPSPALPPHPHHTAPRFPYWSLSGAEFDMRHISPGLELSLRGPHLRSIIRLAAPGETGRRGGDASVFVSASVQVLISMPPNGHGPLKCLRRTSCVSRGLQARVGLRTGRGRGRGRRG